VNLLLTKPDKNDLKIPKLSLLFRFVKDSVLWACLAGLSVAAKQLDTAEVAYANIQVKPIAM
jgi:hypothetical protein